MAKSVKMFTEKPSACMNIRVPTSDSGMVAIGIRLVLSEPRKPRITSSTRAVAMTTVMATSSTESLTGPEVSKAMSMTMPGGADARSSGSIASAAR